jgi:hypothetical protein
MLIVRGDAQALPSELNKVATGEVWFDSDPSQGRRCGRRHRRVLTERADGLASA